jgi:hypothetical protein
MAAKQGGHFCFRLCGCSIPKYCLILLVLTLLPSNIPVETRLAASPADCKITMTESSDSWGLTPAEIRKLRGLKTPHGIQRALDEMPYHLADSAWSPRRVLRENTSHCYEGALFAAAALRVIGYPPLIIDLEAEHDTDHVIAVYRYPNSNSNDGHWGALAKSNYTGCRYREPVYRSLRELAMSYFDTYFNMRGERTLRTFSRPVHMRRFDSLHWMTSEQPVWFVAEYLLTISHYPLITRAQAGRLHRLDGRSFRAGCLERAEKKT